jgi:Flp pilus assembly pilin Flp
VSWSVVVPVRAKCPTGALLREVRPMLNRLLADERGGEFVEFAVIAGVIIVAAFALLVAISDKLVGRWNDLNNIMQ